MSLYNCKKVEDCYRITKFDGDLDVESSYITTSKNCDCPAGNRNTCRHRQMLPEFIRTDRVNSAWFLDWDKRVWADPLKKASWRRI